jgi:hypothetical protein
MNNSAIAQEAEDLLASKQSSSFDTWDEPSGHKAVKIIASAGTPTMLGHRLRTLKKRILKYHRSSFGYDKPDFYILRFKKPGKVVYVFRMHECGNRDVNTAKDFYEWVIK